MQSPRQRVRTVKLGACSDGVFITAKDGCAELAQDEIAAIVRSNRQKNATLQKIHFSRSNRMTRPNQEVVTLNSPVVNIRRFAPQSLYRSGVIYSINLDNGTVITSPEGFNSMSPPEIDYPIVVMTDDGVNTVTVMDAVKQEQKSSVRARKTRPRT